MMLKQITKMLLNVGISIGGMLIAFILLELGLRGVLFSPYDAPDTGDLICAPEVGWRGKPNYEVFFTTGGYRHMVKHNSVGMHDNEHELSKAENSFRILMLGDSFVRASHVIEAETAHQVLEDLLNAGNQSRRFEVISGGVTGWGTGQQLLYYRQEGRRYQPDLVLLMFYVGNDVQNNLPGNALTIAGRNCYAPYFVLCEGQLDGQPWFYSPGLKPELGQCPFGGKLLANTLGTLYSSSQLYTQLEPLFATEQPRFDKLPYYPLYIPEKHELFDYGWQLTVALLKQLQQEVAADGPEFAIVLISPAGVVNLSLKNPEEREAIYQKIPDLRQAQNDLPASRLAAALPSVNILDLQPLFIAQTQQTGEALYFSKDTHWNVAGNRFAAEAIYQWLSKSYGLQPALDGQNVTSQ